MSDIAEKVKFWEEQQRINSLLIPHVVESSKSLESLAKELSSGANQLRSLATENADLKEKLGQLTNQFEQATTALGQQVNTLTATLHNGLKGARKEAEENRRELHDEMVELSQTISQEVVVLRDKCAQLEAALERQQNTRELLPIALACLALLVATLSWVV